MPTEINPYLSEIEPTLNIINQMLKNEQPSPSRFRRTLQSWRNRLPIVSADKVEQPRINSFSWLAHRLFRSRIKLEVIGAEHFETAAKLSTTHPFRITPTHKTDLDHVLVRMAMEQTGHRELADRTVWIAGVKMLVRWYIRLFMRGEHLLSIATPYETRQAKAMNQPTAQKTYNLLNQAAKSRLNKIDSTDFAVVVYPESGRSKDPDGYMKEESPREVAALFPRHHGWVMPLSMTGLLELNPPDQKFNLGRFFKGVNCRIIAGEPYPVEEIWEWARNPFTKKIDRNPMDYVMAKIGALDFNHVHPNKRQYYGQILNLD